MSQRLPDKVVIITGGGKFFRHTPLNQRGQPEEVGAVVAFLASEEASFVTGVTWLVDGGFLSY